MTRIALWCERDIRRSVEHDQATATPTDDLVLRRRDRRRPAPDPGPRAGATPPWVRSEGGTAATRVGAGWRSEDARAGGRAAGAEALGNHGLGCDAPHGHSQRFAALSDRGAGGG